GWVGPRGRALGRGDWKGDPSLEGAPELRPGRELRPQRPDGGLGRLRRVGAGLGRDRAAPAGPPALGAGDAWRTGGTVEPLDGGRWPRSGSGLETGGDGGTGRGFPAAAIASGAPGRCRAARATDRGSRQRLLPNP